MRSEHGSLVEEAKHDIRTWWREDSLLTTLGKLLESVFGPALVARAACHTMAILIAYPHAQPDVSIRARWMAIENEMTAAEEFVCRLFAASYGAIILHWLLPLSISGPPAVTTTIQALAFVNVLVLVADPLFLVSRLVR